MMFETDSDAQHVSKIKSMASAITDVGETVSETDNVPKFLDIVYRSNTVCSSIHWIRTI